MADFPSFEPEFTELRMTQTQFDQWRSYVKYLEEIAAGNIAVLYTSAYGTRWFTFVGENEIFSELREMQRQRDESEKLCAKYRKENETLRAEIARLSEHRPFYRRFFSK